MGAEIASKYIQLEIQGIARIFVAAEIPIQFQICQKAQIGLGSGPPAFPKFRKNTTNILMIPA